MAAIEYHVNLTVVPGPRGEVPGAVHIHLPEASGVLQQILFNTESIMATQAEVVAQLQALLPVIDQIQAETTASLADIQRLQDIIANMPNADPALVDVAAQLATRLATVDGLIPNAPV